MLHVWSLSVLGLGSQGVTIQISLSISLLPGGQVYLLWLPLWKPTHCRSCHASPHHGPACECYTYICTASVRDKEWWQHQAVAYTFLFWRGDLLYVSRFIWRDLSVTWENTSWYFFCLQLDRGEATGSTLLVAMPTHVCIKVISLRCIVTIIVLCLFSSLKMVSISCYTY